MISTYLTNLQEQNKVKHAENEKMWTLIIGNTSLEQGFEQFHTLKSSQYYF